MLFGEANEKRVAVVEERYGKCQDKAGSSVMVKLLEDESDATYMIKTTKKNM